MSERCKCPSCGQWLPKSPAEVKEEHLKSIMSMMNCSRECAEFLDSYGDWSQQGRPDQRGQAIREAMYERKRAWDKIHAKRGENPNAN